MKPRGLLVALIALIVLGIAVVVVGRLLVPSPAANPPAAAACNQILPLVDTQIAAHPGCGDTADGQACYVNSMLQATFSSADAAAGHPFAAPGDLAPINSLSTIRSVPAGVNNSQWGVAKLVIYAAVPNTLGGVPVTFILYGDSQLTNADSEASDAMAAPGPDAYPLRNMKAFYFETGLSPQANCADLNSPDALPGGALLIDQPDGSSAKVKFTADGVDFVLSSGVLLRATKNDSVKVTVLHGSAQLTAMGVSQVGSPGQEIDVPLGGSNGLKASGPPSAPIMANVRPLVMPVVCSVAQAAGLNFPCWTVPPVQPFTPATVPPVSIPTVAAVDTLEPTATLTLIPTVKVAPSDTPTATPTPFVQPTAQALADFPVWTQGLRALAIMNHGESAPITGTANKQAMLQVTYTDRYGTAHSGVWLINDPAQVTVTGDLNGVPVLPDFPAPTVKIIASPAQGYAPLAVKFNLNMLGVFQNEQYITWDFGDGQTGNGFGFSHTYKSAGKYTVKVTANGPSGTAADQAEIVVMPPPPIAAFSIVSKAPEDKNAEAQSGTLAYDFTDYHQGVTLYFNNQSAGDTSGGFVFDFGDGSGSKAFDSYHAYFKPGIYNICLWAYDQNGTASKPYCVSVDLVDQTSAVIG